MKSLYIHIPFCERKCFYCSFVVSIGQNHRVDLYLDCLEHEARFYKGESIDTIYIGGGTPTLMAENQLKRLFHIIREYFLFPIDIEWTIEANPEGLNNSKLLLMKKEGINRISLGVQSFNNKYLKYLGRNHDSALAIKTFTEIKKAGFDNINVDLMFSFPNQTIAELKKDVEALKELECDHLSLYTLTIEKNSKFYAQKIQLADNQNQAKQYMFVCDALKQNGFEQYEVSNFAKPAKISKHNVNYWDGGHYIGLGVGAHSHIGARRFWNISRTMEYISRMQKGHSVQEGYEELSQSDKMKEVLLFGLRMNRGINKNQMEERFGCFLDDEQQKKIDQFVQEGFLIREKECYRTSCKGRLVLDELCAQLI